MLLLLGCQRSPSLQEVEHHAGPFLIDQGKTQEFYFHVEAGWKLTCEALDQPLLVNLNWDQGEAQAQRAEAGPGVLVEFERPGIVEVSFRKAEARALLGGVKLLRPPAPLASATPLECHGSSPNIVVYMVDTLRSDRVGCYGNERGLTPAIDDFSSDSIVFEDLQAASSWTKASVASIFTGVSARQHGANEKLQALRSDLPTLAELLQQKGYLTASFASNPNMDPAFGLTRGFEHTELSILERSERLNQRVFRWLDERDASKPFFLYVHTVDPHDPYIASPELREKFAPGVDLDRYFRRAPHSPPQGAVLLEFDILDEEPGEEVAPDLSRLYDAEVAANDRSFGELLERLKKDGLYESSLIVMVSDHGEEFHEHGLWRHGRTLYEEQLEVPLVMHLPGGEKRGQRVSAQVAHIDMFSTLLEIAGAAVPDNDGRSLFQTSPVRLRESFLVPYPGWAVESLTDGDKKMFRAHSVGHKQPHVAVLDLGQDPAESKNLIQERRVLARYLAAKLDALGKPNLGEKAEIPDSLQEQLRSLNYL